MLKAPDALAGRKARLEVLKSLIKENPSWSDAKLLAIFCSEFGLTQRKGREYLAVIRAAASK